MSPEQARGQSVDARSDLFSLGSVLYAMCTGHAPFRADSSYGVLRLITDSQPRCIREINPAIPGWLEQIVMKLLAKSPDDRYSSAAEVASLLEGCLAHLQQPTITALPESINELRPAIISDTTLATKPDHNRVGRRLIWVVVGLLLLTALGAGVIIGIHGKPDQQSSEDDAAKEKDGMPVQTVAAVGPMIEFELRVRGEEVTVTYLNGICVSDDGLVVLPISAKSLADDTPITAIKPAGAVTIVGSDDAHRLTLVKFKPRNDEQLRFLKCSLALPLKGQRFSILTDRAREVEVTSVGQSYWSPLKGEDGFLVEPLNGTPIGSPLIAGDDELIGIMLQVSAFVAQVPNDELRNVNLPAVHIQKLIDEYWTTNNKWPPAAKVPFTFDAVEVPWDTGRKLNADEKFSFGAVRDNLQLGVALPAEPGHYRAGDEVICEVAIRNAGNERVRFVLSSPQQPITIVDSDGKSVSLVWYEPDFESLPNFISLAPGETFKMQYRVSLTPEPKNSGALGPWWEAPQPGSYKLHAGLSLDIVPSDDPRPKQATQIFVRSAQVQLVIANASEDSGAADNQ